MHQSSEADPPGTLETGHLKARYAASGRASGSVRVDRMLNASVRIGVYRPQVVV
jgi:hypothetical protein